jgi:RNA polymerase sigma-70 factor (ECF subfamily)
LGNAADAEEIAQEALLRTWRELERLRDPGCRNAWAFRTVLNLSMNALRKRHRQRRVEAKLARVTPVDGPATERQNSLIERIRLVLVELSDRQHAALVLREMEGMDYAQVGAIIGVRPAAARLIVYRAREALRRKLIRRWPDCLEEMR